MDLDTFMTVQSGTKKGLARKLNFYEGRGWSRFGESYRQGVYWYQSFKKTRNSREKVQFELLSLLTHSSCGASWQNSQLGS